MSDLPPAVPPFQPDVDTAYAELGKAMAYIKQLSKVLMERAVEANRIDDERLEALRRVEELAAQLEEERGRKRDLLAQLDEAEEFRRAVGSD